MPPAPTSSRRGRGTTTSSPAGTIGSVRRLLAHNTGSSTGVLTYSTIQAQKDTWSWLKTSQCRAVTSRSTALKTVVATNPTPTRCQARDRDVRAKK
ncbi:MAG: hypothetical protein ACRD1D_00430 [Acidimicrobiales bacterium]